MAVILIKIGAFMAGSLLIFLISPGSIVRPKSHGFYRFFAFESILGIIILNSEYWLVDVFSAIQIISWVLLICSLLLAVHGFYMLRVRGKPEGKIENTSVLVQSGAYRYIRHPLYSSLMLLAMGAFFKHVSWAGAFLALLAFVMLYFTADIEEKENIARMGEQYAGYIKKTRKFIPGLF